MIYLIKSVFFSFFSFLYVFLKIFFFFFLLREIVVKLLQYEASTNVADNKGYFPIHLAAWKGDEEIVKILIHHGPSHSRVNEQVHLWNVCSYSNFSRFLTMQSYSEKLIISVFTLPKTFPLPNFLQENLKNALAFVYSTEPLNWAFVKIFVDKKIPFKGSSCDIFSCRI